MNPQRDPVVLAYDLFADAACAAMVAAPDGDAGLNHFRETLITLACMCVSGAAGLSTDTEHARGIIRDMVASGPPIDVLEVIRLNT
jgi:hypothetical protein